MVFWLVQAFLFPNPALLGEQLGAFVNSYRTLRMALARCGQVGRGQGPGTGLEKAL